MEINITENEENSRDEADQINNNIGYMSHKELLTNNKGGRIKGHTLISALIFSNRLLIGTFNIEVQHLG